MDYQIKPLTDVMEKLLGENGCPWDKEQTHESLRKNLLEESHEVIEAIDSNDMVHLKEELGDVLLQVVFHAKLAEQEGQFDLNDVVAAISEKMIRRHPHIFGDVKADNAEEVLTNWEAIKKQEKAAAGQTEESKSIMSKLPPTLPALMKAEKVQQKAHRVGFDWDDFEGPAEKIGEELEEIREAMKGNGDVEEEIGDLLFSVVNIARFAKVDPEQALNRSVEKFVRRFQCVERQIQDQGNNFEDFNLEELDRFWDACKKAEKNV